MTGQTGTQTQETQQTTQLPPWVNDAAQQNYAFAQNVANRPLQQYQGAMVPDTSPQMQQSWDYAASAGNAGVPQFNAATAGFIGALGQTPMSVNPQTLASTDLNPYMNPYTQSVINTSLPIMQQQLGQTLASNAGNAVSQGSFGGSRFGVQQGTAQAQGALGMANMAAGLNQANFTQAQQAATGDITRDLTAQTTNQQAAQNKINSDILASQGLNTAGTNLGQQAQSSFNMLNTAGTQQMAQQQGEINADINKFTQANAYPGQQLGVLQSALGMTPYGQSTTGQSSTETYTPTDWAALAAAGLGAAGSIWSGKGTSDKRLKKNLTKIGHSAADPDVPVYDYNWKGEPAGAPKTRGPLAQDVAKKYPHAVHSRPGDGALTVDTPVLGALSHPAASRLGHTRHTQEHRRRIRPPQIRGALG